ncbi:MAG: radical SAM family heme chaperone HemW, partial [Chloroflexi bacterium]|nr:radical SAM family heme chaperone HemW [Chloroflexota bacterium]
MAGLYIHIPFCVRKCHYCDFYSVPGKTALLDSYLDALFLEAGKYRDMEFETLYIGGGTPSILGPKRLEALIKGLSQHLDMGHLQEASIEVNPESADADFLSMAFSLGINRISIGVQSLNDNELKKAGRIHNARTAIDAIDTAARCGFENISADVIIGLPGQTAESLVTTLTQLEIRRLTHLSAYCLSIEKNTPFAVSPPEDLVEDDGQAILFEEVVQYLRQHGFKHYEISNFSLRGKECLHNLNYWRGGEYVGLGPSAASHINGRRMKNSASLERYLEGPLTIEVEEEELGPAAKMAEEAMLRLRLLEEGLELKNLERRYACVNVGELKSRLDKM